MWRRTLRNHLEFGRQRRWIIIQIHDVHISDKFLQYEILSTILSEKQDDAHELKHEYTNTIWCIYERWLKI